MAPRRGQPCGTALRVVVMDEAEIKRSVRAQAQIVERREIAVIGAALCHRHMEELDRALDLAANGFGHLDHEGRVFWLYALLVGRAAVAEMVAELDPGRHRIADL